MDIGLNVFLKRKEGFRFFLSFMTTVLETIKKTAVILKHKK